MFDSIRKVLDSDPIEIRVAMLGPRRAGKTSMLSAMFERFETALLAEKVADKMHLSADSGTETTLRDNYSELKAVIQRGGNISEAITGDSEAHTYGFTLKRHRTDPEPQIRLVFQDYPGGWLMAGARDPTDAGYRQVFDFVHRAQVLLVAVDTPYLMEEGGKWHNRRNMPDLVARTVREAWSASDPTPRMVILVPIKCEKYDRSKRDRQTLVEATRNAYAELLEHLAHLPLCAVLCAPAQTTGCVVFDHFLPMEPGDDLPAPVFSMPDDPGKRGYNPRDCSQTLRYCLSYALRRYVKGNGGDGFTGKLKGKLREFFKLDRNFVEGSTILAAGCQAAVFQEMKHGDGPA